MMRIFEELTGTKYPYNKYDQTFVAGFQFGGMENITATTMADTEIFFARFDFARGIVTDLVSHELAHSWFGNLVTCNNWAELWLNEGFATFMEAAYREKKYGREDYDRKIKQNAEEFLTTQAVSKKQYGLFNRTAGNIAGLFDISSITYDKGGAVLHTLREEIGDEAFWKGIKIYLDRHAKGNVQTPDLRKAMEDASEKGLGWFFDQWVYGTGAPSLKLTPVYNADKKELTLTVAQIQKAEGLVTNAFRMPMQIEFKNGETTVTKNIDVTKRSEVFTFELDAKPESIKLDPKNKIPIKFVKIDPMK
jgi:aminopeptidase N